MDKILGRLGMGQGEMNVFMTRCDMCDPECLMVINPESLRVRKSYS